MLCALAHPGEERSHRKSPSTPQFRENSQIVIQSLTSTAISQNEYVTTPRLRITAGKEKTNRSPLRISILFSRRLASNPRNGTMLKEEGERLSACGKQIDKRRWMHEAGRRENEIRLIANLTNEILTICYS